MNTYKETHIDKTDLPARLRHLLLKNGIVYVSDLKMAMENKELRQLKQMGEKSIEHLQYFLSQVGDASDYSIRDHLVLDQSQGDDINGFSGKQNNFTNSKFASSVEPNEFNRILIDELQLPLRIQNALQRNGVKTIGDLKIRYAQGSLGDIREIGTKSIAHIKYTLETIYKDHLDFLVSKRPKITNWASLVEPFLAKLDERSIYILLARYGYENQTLEEIASKFGVTRERVRQIQQRVAGRYVGYTNSLDAKPLLFKLGDVINNQADICSRKELEKILFDQGLLGTFGESVKCKNIGEIDVLETLFCWLKIKSSSRYPKDDQKIDIDFRSLQNSKIISSKNIELLERIPIKIKREIKKKVIHRGGIELYDAINMLGVSKELTLEVLEDLDLVEIKRMWFSLNFVKPCDSRSPLKLAGLKMLAVCNEMDFDVFYDGLCKHASRFYESISPPEIVAYMLQKMRFEINGQAITTNLSTINVLSDSEKCFIKVVRNNGNVASFLEIAEGFFAQGLSLPAVANVASKSPIVEKVNNGFYKLRGCEITWEEIEAAHNRQKRFTQNEEILYGLDGVLRVKITVTSYSFLTGVFYANRFKDLSGDWLVVHEGGSVSRVKMDGLFIWGLARSLEELNVKIGDRIELAFNTWKRVLSVRRV